MTLTPFNVIGCLTVAWVAFKVAKLHLRAGSREVYLDAIVCGLFLAVAILQVLP